MTKAADTLREALDAHMVREDDINDEIETSREELKEATRAHNARVGAWEREREALQQEGRKLLAALEIITGD